MKAVLAVCSVLIVVMMGVLTWANNLPAEKSHQAIFKIDAPVDSVFSAMTDWTAQSSWRNGIASVEMIDTDSFVEHPVNGPSINFDVVALEPNTRIALNMSGPFEGEYEALLSFNDGVTTIMVSERITQTSLTGRIASTFFVDLGDFANTYFQELEAYLKS